MPPTWGSARSDLPLGLRLRTLLDAIVPPSGRDAPLGSSLPPRPGLVAVSVVARAHLGPDDPERAGDATAAALAMLGGRIAGIPDPDRRMDALVVAALASAGRGRRVHLVSMSGPKARVLADRAAPALQASGVSFAHIPDDADFDARRAGYASAVVFASIHRLAHDRLRDRVEAAEGAPGARGHVRRLSSRSSHVAALVPADVDALVDDADLLMLEAVRPVRFAGSADPDRGRLYADQAFAILSMMEPDRHYGIDPATLRISLTEAGRARLDTFSIVFGGAWSDPAWREETTLAAIAIRDLFRPSADYTIEDGRVVVNRGTGGSGPKPSIPDLIAAKEGLRDTPGPAHLSDTRRTFLTYARLGGAAPQPELLAPEFRASYGLGTWTSPNHPPRPATIPTVHPNRAALLDSLAGLLVRAESTWVWAPTRDDAAGLPPALRACRILVAEEPFAELGDPIAVVQCGTALLGWEARIAQAFPRARHFAHVSPQDGLLQALGEGDAHRARFVASPSLDTYRAAQAAVAGDARQRRLAHLRSASYFDRILGFLGDSP